MAYEHLFYGELAPWWPLLSPVEEYAEEAAGFVPLLASAQVPVREVLELGSGGGNNAVYLRQHFRMTLVDLSEQMLEVSRRLNPDCEHVQADMRTVRLGREFDAVFVHDAITYMVTEDDLRAAMVTAHEHCRPGGVVVLVPDETAEAFAPTTESGGSDGADGRSARYMAWTWQQPDQPQQSVTEYSFLLREADGSLRSLHEQHVSGLFSRDTWLRLLAETGFQPSAVKESTTEDRLPREIFVGHRPA